MKAELQCDGNCTGLTTHAGLMNENPNDFSDGSVAWVLQDPEGNEPGHLDIHKPILEKKARRK